jgi:CubicO group peptidase (beta-lactamase class C family)
MAAHEQPGLSIAIVDDQEVVWQKGYGFADVERRLPATPATLYRIASITKLFTATAILQLRDEGRLRLDDCVVEHLPWFRIRNVHPGGPAITLRHLLTHTSGMPRQVLGDNYNELEYPTREEMIRGLAKQETVFPAESLWKYSNLALAVAGEVIEAVSGEPYADYVEKHILLPLGMKATRVLPAPETPGLAVGYTRRTAGKAREAHGFIHRQSGVPAGNIASSVEDLAKFATFQMQEGPNGGKRILKRSTVKEMQRVHWLRPDWRSGQGLGFAIRRVGDQVRVGHSGGLPGFRSLLQIAPDQRLAVIVLTNSDDGEPRLCVNQAFCIVGPAIARATAPAQTTAEPDPAWDRYLGTYTWQGEDIHILVLGGRLTMLDPEAENPWESRVTLVPAGSHQFRMKGGYADGELLVFDVDASGRAGRVSAPGGYWLRKP